MGVKVGNEWSPSGDYGTEFKNELDRMIQILNNSINHLESYKKTLNTSSGNTELTEESIEKVQYTIKKLNKTIEDLKREKARIRIYNY